jgi:hypothetical protein
MDFITDHIYPLLNILGTGVITGLLGYVFGRKKQAAEIETITTENNSKELANVDKLLNLYKETLDDLVKRHEAKIVEMSALYEKKIKLLNDEISLHKRIVASLKEENATLRDKLKAKEEK